MTQTSLCFITIDLTFAKLDTFNLCNVSSVCQQWNDVYKRRAMKLCKKEFKAYLTTVNVPLLEFSDFSWLSGYYIKVGDEYKVLEYDQTNHLEDIDLDEDDLSDVTQKVISWDEPFTVEPPTQLFNFLVDHPLVLRHCFASDKPEPRTFHMCLLSLEDQENFFIAPQEWFPLYEHSNVTIGYNVRTKQYGMVFYIEEDSYNLLLDESVAIEIMTNAYSQLRVGKLIDIDQSYYYRLSKSESDDESLYY